MTKKEFFLVWISAIIGGVSASAFDQMVLRYRSGLNAPESAHSVVDPIIGFVYFMFAMLVITVVVIAAGSYMIGKLSEP